MSQPERLGDLLLAWRDRTLRARAEARSVSTMTTYRNRDDVTELQIKYLVGQLITEQGSQQAAKTFVHEVLDNGFSFTAFLPFQERAVWDLVQMMKYQPFTEVWHAQEELFARIDEYDLFND